MRKHICLFNYNIKIHQHCHYLSPLQRNLLSEQLHQLSFWAPYLHTCPIAHRAVRINFFCLAVPCIMWDLSSPTRDGIRAPCSGTAVLIIGLPGKPQN